MRRLALVLVSLALACQHPYLVPETPVPSEQRIRDLAKIEQPAESKEAPFQIKLVPELPVANAGGAVWVHCYVPRSFPDSMIVYGVTGHQLSGPSAVDRIEFSRMVENLSCGTWTAFCAVQERMTGKQQRREIALKVRGMCNSDGDDR